MENLKERLLGILQEARPDIDFEKETALVSGKVLDSIDIVGLIGAIDDEFDIRIKPNFLKPQYFDSVDAMVGLLERLDEE